MASHVFSEELMAELGVDPAPRHCLLALDAIQPPLPMGSLEKLPKELTLHVLENLDLQSLYRLSRSCCRARRLVQDFQPYREMLKHAPTLPYILSRTKLLSCHTARHLYRKILRSDRCSSCWAFGAYAFLLTCERVCMSCLTESEEFKLVEACLAKSIFMLTDEQMAAAPSYYCSVLKMTLVRTKDAEAIATVLHEPHSLFVSLGLDKLFISYCSMTISSSATHVPFPSKAGPDGGRFCAGCLLMVSDASVQALSAHQLNPNLYLPSQARRDIPARLYSRAELLYHAKQCPGAQRLLQEGE